MLRMTYALMLVALMTALVACTSSKDGTLASPAPILTALNVATGPAAGGNQVTLTGEGFNEAAPLTVKFGLNDATNLVAISNTEVRVSAPAGMPGEVVDVIVTNGNGSSTMAMAYTYSTLNLTMIAPNVGPSAGGATVTLTGTGFDDGMSTVSFGGIAATMITPVSPTEMTCVAPAGTAGTTVDVSITNDGGTATLANAYAYDPFLLNTIAPNTGSAIGGTMLTLSGVGFAAALPAVTFGANMGANVMVVNDTTLTVETPAGMPGIAVDVTVTSAAGTATSVGGFSYDPFLVFSVVANNGPAAGGNTVTLNGVGFSFGAAQVSFGPNQAANVNVATDGSLTCDVPPGMENTVVPVSVMNTLGTATLINAYTYDDFALDSIAPANGPIVGGAQVTLTGSGFATGGAVMVTIGGMAATNIMVVNDTTVTADTPAGMAGQMADVVVSSGNGALTLTNGYSYDTVNLTGLDIVMGPAAGGNPITLVGTGLDNGAAMVIFGANPAANIAVVSDDGITCDVPAGLIGTTVDVTVMNANGTAILRMSYTYN